MNKTIWILDDEESAGDAVGFILCFAGFEHVQSFTSWFAMESSIAKVQPHLLLLDLCMPDIDGEAVLARVRSLSPESTVVVITGENDVARAVRCMKGGAADYLLKPVHQEKLLETIFDLGLMEELYCSAPLVPAVAIESLLLWGNSLFVPHDLDEKYRLVFDQLRSVIEEEKIHLQHTCSLDSVAELIHTNTTYLSRCINHVYSMSFSVWLARLRLVHFLELAVVDRGYSISGLGNESGFKSRSSFYSSCKSILGDSPAEIVRLVAAREK